MTKRQHEKNTFECDADLLNSSFLSSSNEAFESKKLRDSLSAKRCFVLVDAAKILLPDVNEELKETGCYSPDRVSSSSERSTNSLNINEDALEQFTPTDATNVSDDNSVQDLPSPVPLASQELYGASLDALMLEGVIEGSRTAPPSPDSLEPVCGSDEGLSLSASDLSSLRPSESDLEWLCRTHLPVVRLSDAALLSCICRDLSVVLERLPAHLIRARAKSRHPCVCFDPDSIWSASDESEYGSLSYHYPSPSYYSPPSPLIESCACEEPPSPPGSDLKSSYLFDSIDLNAQESVKESFVTFDFDARWRQQDTTKVEISRIAPAQE